MEIWLDTTHVETIQKANQLGILDGVTTNPSLIAASGQSLETILSTLLNEFHGPLAVQVLANTSEGMYLQAKVLFKHSSRIIPKIPVNPNGIETIRRLSEQGIPTMATAIFEPMQALLALKAGANYVAPYLGKIIDLGENGLEVLSEIHQMKKQYGFSGNILAAGVRDLKYVKACLKMGLCAMTLRKEVFEQLVKPHWGTEKALNNFEQDWKKAKPTIFFEALT